MPIRNDISSLPPVLKLNGAFIRKVDLSDAILRGANLSRADASGALFRNSDFAGANLEGTILTGADLTGAVNLTEEQLSVAIIDDGTRLPAYIDASKLGRLTTAGHQ